MELAGRQGYGLRRKIAISTAVAFFSSAIYAPAPDPFSILVLGTMAAFLCSVPLLILSRFPFMKSASSRVQTLVCVFVYVVATLATLGFALVPRIYK